MTSYLRAADKIEKKNHKLKVKRKRTFMVALCNCILSYKIASERIATNNKMMK